MELLVKQTTLENVMFFNEKNFFFILILFLIPMQLASVKQNIINNLK